MNISRTFLAADAIAQRFYSDPLFNALEAEEALLGLGFHSVDFPCRGPVITAVFEGAKWTAPDEEWETEDRGPRNEDLLREYHSRV